MKLIIALAVTASLMACGGKAKKNATPDNKGTDAVQTDGTGGATYGTPTQTPASGEPAPAQAPTP